MAGNNVKYRLRNIYAKMERSGKCEFESFESFKAWSLNNGYKPWKVLTLLSDDEPYSPDNCNWSLDKRGSNKAISVKKDRSLDNVVKNIKLLSCTTLETRINLNQLEIVCESLLDAKVIDKKVGQDLLRSIKLAKNYVSDAYNSIDKIAISGLEQDELGGMDNENK